jgi:tocopherol O-methyltransferase
MISCPTVTKPQIRWHYDLATLFYRLLWGRHIHHGLWSDSESTSDAQLALTETLADAARITAGQRILDVGCGMGGSSIHLAKARQCHVTGVTLSPVQRGWATLASSWHRVRPATDFRCADAETLVFSPNSFDVVWSVECTEHLFDKPRFFKRAAGWLRPGGRMAICAWLAGPSPLSAEAEKLVYEVCEGFLCPSLGSSDDYRRWFEDAGLSLVKYEDWTDRVLRTWEICLERVERSNVRFLAKAVDRNMVNFLDRFETILQAYRTGAMRYGAFISETPRDTESARTATEICVAESANLS